MFRAFTIKAITEALYKNDTRFHSRQKLLESITVVLYKVAFNDLQTLKKRINVHYENLHVLDQPF